MIIAENTDEASATVPVLLLFPCIRCCKKRQKGVIILSETGPRLNFHAIKVIGHRNPDTDSICAAISYSRLKNAITSNSQ